MKEIKEKNSENFSIWLTLTLKNLIKERAKKERRSMAEIVKMALEEYFKKA